LWACEKVEHEGFDSDMKEDKVALEGMRVAFAAFKALEHFFDDDDRVEFGRMIGALAKDRADAVEVGGDEVGA